MKKIGKDICYAFGNFSGGVVNYAMMTWYAFYYVDHLGLDKKYYAIAMVVYGIWNAINDPLMGVISDKTVSRWGRRKPYMMFGAVPLGLSLVLLFAPPAAAANSPTMLFVFFLAGLCIYDTFFTMTMLAWSAVLPEMYLDESNRARVNVYSQILGVLGAMLATLCAEPLINAFGYTAMAAFFAVIGVITMLMSAWGVREREVNIRGGSLPFLRNFTATFRSKPFIICVISVLFVEVGITTCTSTIAFYSKYAMQFELGVTVIMGTLFVSSMIFAPLIGMFSRKFGVKNTYILAMGIFIVAGLGFYLAPSIVVAVGTAAIAGIGVSGTMIMPNMLYAEVIDDDQVRTGVRRDGSFFGMNALVMRLSIVIQGVVTTFIWEQSGYVEGAATQGAPAIQGIRVLMGMVPLAFTLLAVVVLLFYPINKKRLMEVQEKVRLMNQELEETQI